MVNFITCICTCFYALCGQNYMRVVEVWLDREHREFFYTREPSVRGYPIGDVSQQLKFKEEHKCKDFKWFMENVAYEVYERFPKLPPNKAWGEVMHIRRSPCFTDHNIE